MGMTGNRKVKRAMKRNGREGGSDVVAAERPWHRHVLEPYLRRERERDRRVSVKFKTKLNAHVKLQNTRFAFQKKNKIPNLAFSIRLLAVLLLQSPKVFASQLTNSGSSSSPANLSPNDTTTPHPSLFFLKCTGAIMGDSCGPSISPNCQQLGRGEGGGILSEKGMGAHANCC